MTEALDRRFLAAAIRLGAGALGATWPNPAVGAILVKQGRVVGRGRTDRGGRPHAETQALAMAGEAARGSTLYVSLEPCSHHGKTPPCVDAIVAAGVSRVVAPIVDPDPRVAGKGFDRLRAAAIDVAIGPMADAARRSHAGYLRRTEQGVPYVLLKLAVSADDAIGRVGEAQVAVTGAIARRHAQALRARFDAILVGRGTVEADDPALTCRLPGLESRSPIRVLLDSGGKLDAGRRIFGGEAPTWVFVEEGKTQAVAAGGITSPLRGGRSLRSEAEQGSGGGLGVAAPLPPPETDRAPLAGFDLPSRGRLRDASAGARNRIRHLVVPRGPTGLDLAACLRRLAEEGITRVLVEGGAHVARSFLEAGLVDAVMLFRSPAPLGGRLVPALAGLPLSEVEGSPRFRRIERRRFVADRMTLYERVR
jgi:diaminohydroxyphosphoribosylaminopyrimidine deaminase/5-amino-6-(5-phosphoribosylamino)uracil reductase